MNLPSESVIGLQKKIKAYKVYKDPYILVLGDKEAETSTVSVNVRGSNSQLWNDSVKITADDLIEGKNTVVVTDWSNTGYLTSTYDYDMTVDLTLSAASGEAFVPPRTSSTRRASPRCAATLRASWQRRANMVSRASR